VVNHDRLALLVHRGAVYRSTGVDCSGFGNSLQYRLEDGVLPPWPSEWHWNMNGMQQQYGTDSWNWGFSGVHSAQTLRPPPNHGTSLGCQLAPKMIPITQNSTIWAVAWVLDHKHPLEITHFSCFGCWKTLLHRNLETFHLCMHVQTDSCLLFLKMVEISAG